MSNDAEFLHKIGAPTSIIMNGEPQTYTTLRDSIRAIYLAVRYDNAESANITWVEAREAELDAIQGVIDNIRKYNEFSSFLLVFRDAKTLIDVKKKDIKGGWGFDINGFQEWTDLHYGQETIGNEILRKMTFWVKYSRDHYGIWKREIVSQSEDGEVRYLGNFVSDKELGNAISRFEHGDPKCLCNKDLDTPTPHVFYSEERLAAIKKFGKEIRYGY
ncbi:hypothetical protein PISL3812_09808 [Talaromyces islandicus]|uniref:Uncharacterized protein n=1 Tax=Talaromyces islandicus TaxID=28573 RepID=A0A0U1MCB0_TALIS|nr:hypothetical protein PISL3812_09808 [Talaromyces islandicus]